MGYIFFKPLSNSSSLISFSLRAICVTSLFVFVGCFENIDAGF
jgi:hypothetical protein